MPTPHPRAPKRARPLIQPTHSRGAAFTQSTPLHKLACLVAIAACLGAACVDFEHEPEPDRRADLLRGGDPVDLRPYAIDDWNALKATCTLTPDAKAPLADGRTMLRLSPDALGFGPTMSWVEADGACARLGGVLATLNTKDAREAAATLASPVMSEVGAMEPWSAWIGLVQERNALDASERWGWRDGADLFVSDWAPGEPDDDDGAENHEQNCSAVGEDGWRDAGCIKARAWPMLCVLPEVHPNCVGEALCAPVRHDGPYMCQCDPGEAYLPGSGGCVVKPSCTTVNPQSCDGVCDPQDDADSGDCNGVCMPNDSAGSPDCDGVCNLEDWPGSPDCDDACGGRDVEGSPDCDGICAPRDEEDYLDCDGDCDPYDVLNSPDCDGGCSSGESPESLDCDGRCDRNDSFLSPDCDGVCDPGDTPLSPDCDDC